MAADSHRMLGFLYLAEAGILSRLKLPHLATPGIDPDPERAALAEKALRAYGLSTNWLRKAEETAPPSLLQAIEQSQIHGYLELILCTAHSILWDIRRQDHHKQSAMQAWSKVPVALKARPPAPEVAAAVGVISPGTRKDNSMTTVAWAGLALVVLGVVAAMAARETNIFQQWTIRVLIALGAAMAATVIPGLLNINLPGYVAAGGALAVIVLLYKLNPPPLPSNGTAANPERTDRRKRERKEPVKTLEEKES